MSENTVKWNPFPQEKPYCDDKYLVSVKLRKSEYVTVLMYFDDEFENFHDCEVMAWAELPKPYDKRRTRNVKVKWHPYPEYKPNSLVRNYLVTGIYKNKRKVSISNWYKSQNVFDKEDIFSVIAWAEMPEPYKEETNEG